VSAGAPGAPPPLDDRRWIYRGAILPFARALARYHRATFEGGPPPAGPCIYVALHGAGYLVLDLVLAGYFLQWKGFHERGAPHVPLRVVAARSRIERVLPGLPRLKERVGVIGTAEEDCVAVLERGEQLLVTPGGMREARPSRDFYRLRWEGRYGFARLALRTGAPIVPLAVVGGAEAYPGFRVGRLSFWAPLPLPARLRVALGEPIPVARAPERARDLAALRPLHALARERTQALYDALRARRGGRS
jgi:1-acyl-sn-glycerol-3-phosphate acyltransferase